MLFFELRIFGKIDLTGAHINDISPDTASDVLFE